MSFKIVITGASGFIGGALLTQMIRNNIPVTGLSRQKKKGLTTVSSYIDWPSSRDEVLIHLAQPRDASTPSSGNEIALCRLLSAKPWRHILYVSSSIVYGDSKEYPRRPDEEVAAINDYAKAKIACESIVTNAGGTCLRFANVYGSGMATNSVIADILNQIPGKGPLMVKDKKPVRDFLWIEDAVNALVSASILRPGGIYNVGSGEGLSIGKVAELLLSLAGEENRPILSKIPTERLSSLVLDISKTRSILNWSPKLDMISGLASLLKKKINNL